MKKQEMPSQEALRALYPSNQEKDREAVRATLAGLPDNEKEQPMMKKKISVALVCACILLAMTCVAIAVSTNVFGLLAEKYNVNDGTRKLINTLDQKSAQDGASQTVEPSDGKYNQVQFTVEQSYYDGESLYISYSLKGAEHGYDDTWLPTEEELTTLDLREVAIQGVDEEKAVATADVSWYLDDTSLIDALKALKAKGGKQGMIVYSSYLSDGAYYGDQEDQYLDLSMSDEQRQEDGTLIGYKGFETPLPDDMRNKDSITVRFMLYRGMSYAYYDGEKWYTGGGDRTGEAMPVTISRTAENDAKSYPFTAEFDTYSVTGTLTMSAIKTDLAVTLTSKTDKPMYQEEATEGINFLDYDVYAGDEELRVFSGEFGEEGMSLTILTSFNAPATPVSEIRLVPRFTDLAKESKGENGFFDRPEEAIVIPLSSVEPTTLPAEHQ